MADEFSQKYCC